MQIRALFERACSAGAAEHHHAILCFTPCVPRRRDKKPDPKEQVKKWKQQMRAEERKVDRQITSTVVPAKPRQDAPRTHLPCHCHCRNKERGDEGEAIDQTSSQEGRYIHGQAACQGDCTLSQGRSAAAHIKGADELGRHADAEPDGCVRLPCTAHSASAGCP